MSQIKAFSRFLDRVLKRVVTVSAGLAAIIVFVMMFPITLDVIMRYVFNNPLHGTYQLAEFMMVGTVYLAVAYVQLHREHIKLEVATNWLHPRYRHLLDVLGHLVGLAVFGIIAWQSGLEAFKTWRIGDYTMGLVEWPLWPAKAAVSYGAALLVLQLFTDCIRDIAHWGEIVDEMTNNDLQEGTS